MSISGFTAPRGTFTVFIGVDFQPLDEGRGCHILLVADEAQHHHSGQELGGHHDVHLRDVRAQSPDILPVDLSIVREVLLNREDNELAWLRTPSAC
jgi:hypothetical protein